jgi:hypothetical protein
VAETWAFGGVAIRVAIGMTLTTGMADGVVMSVAVAVAVAVALADALAAGVALAFIKGLNPVPTHRPASLYWPPQGQTRPLASGPMFAA